MGVVIKCVGVANKYVGVVGDGWVWLEDGRGHRNTIEGCDSHSHVDMYTCMCMCMIVLVRNCLGVSFCITFFIYGVYVGSCLDLDQVSKK